MSTVRRYRVSFEILVRDQDDMRNWQPDTVVGSAPAFGVEWVSGTDAEAPEDFWRFFLKLSDIKHIHMNEVTVGQEADDGE